MIRQIDSGSAVSVAAAAFVALAVAAWPVTSEAQRSGGGGGHGGGSGSSSGDSAAFGGGGSGGGGGGRGATSGGDRGGMSSGRGDRGAMTSGRGERGAMSGSVSRQRGDRGPRISEGRRDHSGRRHSHRRHRHDGVSIGIYTDDSYGYYPSCEYYRRRAVATGSGYWWRRFRDCIY